MDKEKLKGYLDKAKTALGKISKKIWIIIAIAVAVLVIAIVIFLKTRPYATLIAGATDEETATVLSWLQENGFTDYKMEGSGTILVPAGQAPSLKARLLQEQYSKSDSSYSAYFEQVGALSTQEDRRVAQLATLTDNYRKTILQFPGVRDVDVSINPGENRGYVLDSNNMVEASAGVFLFMQNGKTLTDGQANAIRNYIAAGGPGLLGETGPREASHGP
ncbi:MAG: flagellar M-ring protein FliF, partial [Oscillospiraceae bacterium]|nr:flagellar M-ring protein FliF [Oscillospiraceae bacterium]